MPFHVKSSMRPRPKGCIVGRVLEVDLSVPEYIGSSGPSAFGCRFAPTLIGARKMCRCLLLSTKIRKPNTTAMLISRNAVSSTSLTPAERVEQDATNSLANAPPEAWNGNVWMYSPSCNVYWRRCNARRGTPAGSR